MRAGSKQASGALRMGVFMNASNRKIGPGFNQKSALNIQETLLPLLLPLLNRFTNEDIL